MTLLAAAAAALFLLPLRGTQAAAILPESCDTTLDLREPANATTTTTTTTPRANYTHGAAPRYPGVALHCAVSLCASEGTSSHASPTASCLSRLAADGGTQAYNDRATLCQLERCSCHSEGGASSVHGGVGAQVWDCAAKACRIDAAALPCDEAHHLECERQFRLCEAGVLHAFFAEVVLGGAGGSGGGSSSGGHTPDTHTHANTHAVARQADALNTGGGVEGAPSEVTPRYLEDCTPLLECMRGAQGLACEGVYAVGGGVGVNASAGRCADALCGSFDTAFLNQTVFRKDMPVCDGDTAHGDGSHACSVHSHDPPYNILVMAGLMALGALCRYHSASLPLSKVPYTVQIFVLGGVWGVLCRGVGGTLKQYGELGDIDPHLLFFTFLPVLIFESAFATDIHIFSEVKFHCLILAGPGLIACSLLTAVVAKIVFVEYNWNWVACLLFGCLLSATDPVAVVALLKELGADKSISQLIEGESLLNDGSAIVFFNILKGSVALGEVKESAFEVVLELCKVAGGGCLLGLLLGIVVKIAIKRVFNDAMIEVTLTLVAAYATFFVAEAYLQVSGVLALVILGMYLSKHIHVISPEVIHSLHDFWEMLGYIGNTLIFAIAGMVITEKAFVKLHMFDFMYLLVNYLLLNIIRGSVIFILQIPMNSVGNYQLTWRDALLCTWGGLRGAVGLALALIIENDVEIECADPYLGARFLFHVAGVVVLTLCLNGVTTGQLVSVLQLDKVATSRRINMNRAFSHLLKSIDDSLLQRHREPMYHDANWGKTRAYVTTGLCDPFTKSDLPEGSSMFELLHEPHQDACEHYWCLVEQAVSEQHRNGTMRPSSVRVVLQQLAEGKKMAVSTGIYVMMGADFLTAQFEAEGLRERAMFWRSQHRYSRALDTGIGFMSIHENVLKRVDGACHTVRACNLVRDHCKRVRRRTLEIIEHFSRTIPEVAIALKTRNAARDTLNAARICVETLVSSGKLSAADGALLRANVEGNMKRLAKTPCVLPQESDEKVLRELFPWYTATPESHDNLKRSFVTRHFDTDENILGRDLEGKTIICIIRGVIRVNIGGRAEVFGPGYAAGLSSLLSAHARYSEVAAETQVVAVAFTARLILTQCEVCPVFRALLWEHCCRQTTHKVLAATRIYSDWDHVKLHNFVKSGSRLDLGTAEEHSTTLPSDTVCVLISGSYKDGMRKVGDLDRGKGPCLVAPGLAVARFSKGAVVFGVKAQLGERERARKRWGLLRSKITLVGAMSRGGGAQSSAWDLLTMASTSPAAGRAPPEVKRKRKQNDGDGSSSDEPVFASTHSPEGRPKPPRPRPRAESAAGAQRLGRDARHGVPQLKLGVANNRLMARGHFSSHDDSDADMYELELMRHRGGSSGRSGSRNTPSPFYSRDPTPMSDAPLAALDAPLLDALDLGEQEVEEVRFVPPPHPAPVKGRHVAGYLRL